MRQPEYPHVEASLRYAKDVVAGKIPACELTKLACERQLKDLKRKYNPVTWPYVFDLRKAERICRFIEKLPHIKGEWGNKLLVLEPWQCFYFATKHGWVFKETGYRRFRKYNGSAVVITQSLQDLYANPVGQAIAANSSAIAAASFVFT